MDAEAPSPSESTGDMLQAFTKYLPELTRVTGESILPLEQALLKSSQAVSPGYANLQADIYDTAGRKLNQTGNEIARSNALYQANTDKQVLDQSGGLVDSALKLQRQADPEFFKSREALSGKLTDTLGSLDPNGGLSGSERSEIERSLNRENLGRGLTVPSATSTVENAMRFGQAGRNRQLENVGALNQTFAAGAGLLPSFKTGIDPFQVATGKSSFGNTGDNKFLGTQQTGQAGLNASNNFMNTVGGFTTQANDINSKRRDVLDRMNETTSSLPSD